MACLRVSELVARTRRCQSRSTQLVREHGAETSEGCVKIRSRRGHILCKGMTRATCIHCIEQLRTKCLRQESYMGPPALQAMLYAKSHEKGVIIGH